MSSTLENVNVAAAEPAHHSGRTTSGYPRDDKRKGAGFFQRLALTPPRWVLAYWRWRRVPSLFGIRFVARYDEVTEVLSRPDVFAAPFADEIRDLGGGTPFLLGIDDRDNHDAQLQQVMQIFSRADLKDVRDIARNSAEQSVRSAKAASTPTPPCIDAVQKLITSVALDICEHYYGIDFSNEDRQLFADATIDVSGHLFGSNPTKEKRGPRVAPAAQHILDIVDASLRSPRDKTIASRLVKLHLDPGLARAILIGMIMGFVPTNTMAAGHILDVLLCKPKAMDAARSAARSGDDDWLNRCLLEALRFMPINPGPFRTCTTDFTIAAGTPRAKKIPADAKVLASTFAAMFDRRAVREPRDFKPGRPASEYLHFGHGLHWCVGAYIAQTHMTQTFMALLRQERISRASKLKLRGTFPDHLCVKFEPGS
jgi:cytochrome P450